MSILFLTSFKSFSVTYLEYLSSTTTSPLGSSI
nr:MAG TPA: hypothetical protein [Caudoviricetes sp.]